MHCQLVQLGQLKEGEGREGQGKREREREAGVSHFPRPGARTRRAHPHGHGPTAHPGPSVLPQPSHGGLGVVPTPPQCSKGWRSAGTEAERSGRREQVPAALQGSAGTGHTEHTQLCHASPASSEPPVPPACSLRPPSLPYRCQEQRSAPTG